MDNNQSVSAEIEWSSDNEDVATVENGLITAVSIGKAKITASAEYKGETFTGSIWVTVDENAGFTLSTYQVQLALWNETTDAPETVTVAATATVDGKPVDEINVNMEF